jgi:Domain of Unknown Function (DUF928)
MFKHYRLGLAIALVAVLASNTLPSMAISKGIPARWAAKRYKVPAVGSPLRRESAATRGDCPVDPAIALTPLDGIATTTTAYPTLFFRVPASSDLPVEFTLQDGKKTVYQTKFPLTGARRTISITLPSADLAPLTIDRDYRWRLLIRCSNDPNNADHLVTSGIVRRVVPDAAVTAKLQTLARSEAALSQSLRVPEIYAEAEIWQDALMELVRLRRLQPQNPQVLGQWRRLLKSADLDAVVNDPLSPELNHD